LRGSALRLASGLSVSFSGGVHVSPPSVDQARLTELPDHLPEYQQLMQIRDEVLRLLKDADDLAARIRSVE
jgi:hypothetical protein